MSDLSFDETEKLVAHISYLVTHSSQLFLSLPRRHPVFFFSPEVSTEEQSRNLYINMDIGINKQQADQLVDKYITNQVTKYHLLESEAIMRALARHFDENEEEWGIIGLLHDIDWDLTKENPCEHTVKAVEILKSAGASDFLIETIVSHGYGSDQCGVNKDKIRTTKIQHALASAETLTGLIVASALVQPDKKLASVTVPSLLKKFKSKNFAAKCDRGIILECEKIGLKLEEFLAIGLNALQEISSKIGL